MLEGSSTAQQCLGLADFDVFLLQLTGLYSAQSGTEGAGKVACTAAVLLHHLWARCENKVGAQNVCFPRLYRRTNSVCTTGLTTSSFIAKTVCWSSSSTAVS
jgi:hypothetical protein